MEKQKETKVEEHTKQKLEVRLKEKGMMSIYKREDKYKQRT